MIKVLKSNRDMAFNEIKLTVMIEDPRARERRENLNIEVSALLLKHKGVWWSLSDTDYSSVTE